MLELESVYLDRVSYAESSCIQERVHREVSLGARDPLVLYIEHKDTVITSGKRGLEEDFILEKSKFPVKFSERGGKMTAHMPGQLVVYPILPLLKYKIGVRDYIAALEESGIETLKNLGFSAAQRSGYPGLWVDGRKLASVGVRIKNKVTMHGLALNICADLKVFEGFAPCGFPQVRMCQLSDFAFSPPSLKEVAMEFQRQIQVFVSRKRGLRIKRTIDKSCLGLSDCLVGEKI